MITLYILLIIVFLLAVRPVSAQVIYNDDYISKETTNIIKGLCIWVVFICHISVYVGRLPGLNFADNLLFVANHYVRQLLVAPFLFYSGYGVTLALKNKGHSYGSGILKNRCLTTLVNFDVAVLFFVVLNYILGREYDVKTVLLSFTGWESIGNSNWYIFCIIICYAVSWIAYKICGITNKMIYSIVILVLLYTIVMYWFSEGCWWYNTAYTYAVGVIFAWNKEKVDKLLMTQYWKIFIVSAIGFLICYFAPDYYSVASNLTAVFMCVLVVLFTYKFKLKSKVLAWSGCHLFPLYIYQRIPMILFSTIAGGTFIANYRYLYVIVCFVVTIGIAFLYKYFNISLKK